MDFDLLHHVATPFRMQPGLSRLDAAARQLTPLMAGSRLWHEKRAVLQASASRQCVPGFDPAPALAAIAEQARLEGCESQLGAANPLELAFEEDFAVLDGDTTTLPWLCVCAPSHWAPEDKVGLPFAAVHAPVADGALLVAASAQLARLVTGGQRWERYVWTISPSGRHDQHPRRHPRAPWPSGADPAAFAAGCWLRAERQTFFPVGQGTRQAVFTIRVMLQPLTHAIDSPDKARRLHDSLASMTEGVLAYKGLTQARDPLLRWLAQRASVPHEAGG
jgi:dimethylamine monooxygenase subunit A